MGTTKAQAEIRALKDTITGLEQRVDYYKKATEELRKSTLRSEVLAQNHVVRMESINNQCSKILDYLGGTDTENHPSTGKEIEGKLDRILTILMPLVTTRIKALEECKALQKKNAALSWLAEREFEAAEHSVAYWRKALVDYIKRDVEPKEAR